MLNVGNIGIREDVVQSSTLQDGGVAIEYFQDIESMYPKKLQLLLLPWEYSLSYVILEEEGANEATELREVKCACLSTPFLRTLSNRII